MQCEKLKGARITGSSVKMNGSARTWFRVVATGEYSASGSSDGNKIRVTENGAERWIRLATFSGQIDRVDGKCHYYWSGRKSPYTGTDSEWSDEIATSATALVVDLLCKDAERRAEEAIVSARATGHEHVPTGNVDPPYEGWGRVYKM